MIMEGLIIMLDYFIDKILNGIKILKIKITLTLHEFAAQ